MHGNVKLTTFWKHSPHRGAVSHISRNVFVGGVSELCASLLARERLGGEGVSELCVYFFGDLSGAAKVP